MPIEAVVSSAALALLAYSALTFPSSLTNGGTLRAVVSAGALSMYAAASVWARRSGSPAVRRSMDAGRAAGLMLAAAAVIGHTLEIFAALPPPVPAMLGVGMWGLMFLVLGAAAAATCAREESVALGIASSVRAVFISASTTVTFALSVGLLYMSTMERLFHATASGVVRNMLDGAMSHLLLAPVVAVAAGAASGLCYSVVKSLRSRTAVALTAAAVIVCAGGLSALRAASALERSARPPYVMLGVLSLGVSLTALAALVVALRRQFQLLRSTL
jgi:hypothetical protein